MQPRAGGHARGPLSPSVGRFQHRPAATAAFPQRAGFCGWGNPQPELRGRVLGSRGVCRDFPFSRGCISFRHRHGPRLAGHPHGESARLPCASAFQGDQGGLRTLQKKWTTFLKARLLCSRPDGSLFFNVLRAVFVLRAPDLKEPVLYGVFTPQL